MMNDGTIEFDAPTHTYRDKRGVIPSVTRVLELAGLVDGKEYFTEFARVRGTYVHQAVAFRMKGTLDYGQLDPVIQPYVDAFDKFILESGFIPSRWEQVVYNETHRYAGTFDFMGEFHGRAALIDIKTGSMPKWAAIQTAGYTLAIGETRLVRYGLELRPDGTYGMTGFADDRRDASVFLGALAVAKWKLEKGLN